MFEKVVIASTSSQKTLNDRVVLRCSNKPVINDVNKLNVNSFSTPELVDNKQESVLARLNRKQRVKRFRIVFTPQRLRYELAVNVVEESLELLYEPKMVVSSRSSDNMIHRLLYHIVFDGPQRVLVVQ